MSERTERAPCPTCEGRCVDVSGCTKSYITGDSEPYNIGTGCACHYPEWCADDPAIGCDECRAIHGPLRPCLTCGGTGKVASAWTVAARLVAAWFLRALRRLAP